MSTICRVAPPPPRISYPHSSGRTIRGGSTRLRANVFAGFPHALYLPPPDVRFHVVADQHTQVADCRAPHE